MGNNLALTTKYSMYIMDLSFLHHQILQLPNPHPTLKKSKINFNQCNFVNILKQCPIEYFKRYENFNKEILKKKCKYRNFSLHTHNIYSLPLFLFQSNIFFFPRN